MRIKETEQIEVAIAHICEARRLRKLGPMTRDSHIDKLEDHALAILRTLAKAGRLEFDQELKRKSAAAVASSKHRPA